MINSDQFSWTMEGYKWGNPYFAYQVVVALLFENLGHVVSALIFGIMGSVAVLVLAGMRLNFWRSLVIILGVGLAIVNLGLRPHTFSFLFFAILLFLLKREFFKQKVAVLFWFIFFILWANFHQGFVVGLVIFGSFLVIDFFWRRFGNKKADLSLRVWCLFSAVLGTVLTPLNLRLWETIIFDLSGPKTWLAISEWQPVVIFFPINLLFGLSGVIFIFIFIRKFREIGPVWALLSAFLFMLPFLAANFVFYWAAVFIVVVSRHFDWGDKLGKSLVLRLPLIFALGAVVTSLVLSFVSNFLVSLDLGERLRRDGYPVDASNFLKNKLANERLFNNYAWGGYIVWQMPEARVFIDGRMTGWKKAGGGYILSDYLEILGGRCDLVEGYKIKLVLLEKDMESKCFYGWQIVYEDAVAKVLALAI